MIFPHAVERVASDLGLDVDLMMSYAEEDSIGGFPEKWHGGSIHSHEGKILYSVVRILQPETLLDLGTYKGCSASHLALACEKNGKGHIYTVDSSDWHEIGAYIPQELVHRVTRVTADALVWLASEAPKAEFVFEDGPHSPGFTEGVIRTLENRNLLGEGAVVFHHDAALPTQYGINVREGLDRTLGSLYRVVEVSPSESGLAYWRRPADLTLNE